MYKFGNGVLKDHMVAYAWYNIAAANGAANAENERDIIIKDMTDAQIAEGQKLAHEMTTKNPKLLNK